MQLIHLLNVENSYTATHSEITLQQKILGLVDVIQKALVHKRGLMGGDTVSVTMGGIVYEMTFHTME